MNTRVWMLFLEECKTPSLSMLKQYTKELMEDIDKNGETPTKTLMLRMVVSCLLERI